MNINIYYGGRGIIDDPTLFVINKMQEVLEELHVAAVTIYMSARIPYQRFLRR